MNTTSELIRAYTRQHGLPSLKCGCSGSNLVQLDNLEFVCSWCYIPPEPAQEEEDVK